ncbi:hypothetical protein FACS18945_4830 [Bacteroidia bacterium]|nr:hypothetical protein FACS18945_4830 [Bacteroidia bacterium]
MKKLLSVIAVSFAFLTGCDSGAKSGDTVLIDFAGYLDGVPFEGGTGRYALKLGSNTFVPGFEDQLVGIKKGEEREIKIKFPDQYAPGLSGKDVIFKVKAIEIEK